MTYYAFLLRRIVSFSLFFRIQCARIIKSCEPSRRTTHRRGPRCQRPGRDVRWRRAMAQDPIRDLDFIAVGKRALHDARCRGGEGRGGDLPHVKKKNTMMKVVRVEGFGCAEKRLGGSVDRGKVWSECGEQEPERRSRCQGLKGWRERCTVRSLPVYRDRIVLIQREKYVWS
ncbi:hypothetical protein P152DRAFT_67932 [Eremomyces bilateralis CBS 781.70]|uniref:Uncharacterized protein n=1 Tax=Eremomyces bilateralis CBS 781.70 TaxID=1392243 RepID=A0A6G1G033_9PEZI|nr:uncharacterized protein P152DRAFT_67932 [Eremomyces bilateralis CBS 781.70]KAF1811286.1 hypothetical protein P152DRAFT_67932 [Eremomyces bilateralis CBS 781.70]